MVKNSLDWFSLPSPNRHEAEALRVVGRYLNRTADAAGTRRLQPSLPVEERMLLDVLREQATAWAALCDGLLDTGTNAEGWR